MTEFVTRFAPSPTGRLHLGHAYSAWQVWQAAERAGGLVLLRIEDIDTTRCRPEFTQNILEDLAWLGFEWPEPVRIQSQHFDTYAETVADLAERGLAYRCFRSRSDLQVAGARLGPLPKHEETRNLDAGLPFAWRLSMDAARQALGEAFSQLSFTVDNGGHEIVTPVREDKLDDFIIARKDSPSAYHLAATQDDQLQGITHIIRGEDLIDAPHVQTVLQALMGWRRPVYSHHKLIVDHEGKRFSKRDRSIALHELRAAGLTPDDLWKRLGVA
ncbi:MAG: tRNA glutamyl-Q(34) synthetase GluQRS [Henriciella sp.]|nr:tRNA glutamyl-Q(34) synthetase GluQRS [Henriciella sp.]